MVWRRSEHFRYYNCLDKFVAKYELKLVAGNFFISDFQPCVEDGRDKLDDPEPQHITKAEEKAHLPVFRNWTEKLGWTRFESRHFLVLSHLV